jgi:integrase
MTKYTINKLSPSEVRHAKPEDKLYRLRDGGGLYCDVLPTGKKVWRYNYRIHQKQKSFTIGEYPNISLSDARRRRDEAKQQVSESIDPSEQKQISKHSLKENSFEAIAKAWLEHNKNEWSEGHYQRNKSYLIRDVFPFIGNADAQKIEAPEIISIIKKVADRGAIDASKRVKGFIQQVFNYAVAHGKASRNPAKDVDLNQILPKTISKHYAAITDPEKLGELLRVIDGYQGSIVVRLALKILPMTMLRPSELANGEWEEIDLKGKIWTIPAKRRKLSNHLKQANRKEDTHIVPLPEQCIVLLEELHQYTGRGKYLFPSPRGNSRPISNNALRTALRIMGFDNDTITAHGFRGVASTFLNTLGYRSEVIEAQLSHKDKNEIRAAYNHADYMEERRVMLQEWANYLDSLKHGAEVIPIQRKQA